MTIRHESAQSGTWNIQLGSTHITELLKGTLTITKDITGDTPGVDSEFTFTITGPNNYSNSVTITGEDSETIDLEPGQYTVSEGEVANYTTTTSTQSAIITAGGAVTLTFTNTYNEGEEEPTTGTLTITKDITGDILPEALNAFTFTIEGPNDYTHSVTITGKGSETIYGLAPGEYTVTEEEVPNYTPDENPKTATITAGGVVTLTFTNTYAEGEDEPTTGTLTITKDITGDIFPEEPGVFTFTIEGPNDYTHTVTITGEGSETIYGLAPGEYTVTEEEVPNYIPDENPQTATITAGGTVTLTFTNAYGGGEDEPTTGELTITKVITGDTPEEPGEFTFIITPVATAYRMALADNSDLVKITGSGTKTCTLEPGEYVVSEINIPDNYENVGEEAIQVTISAGETTEVTFTNRYDKPSDNGGGNDNNNGGGGGKRNRPPRATDDEVKVDQGSEVNIRVLANDWDPDGDRISIKSFTQGKNGQVSLNENETLKYIPDADFTGTDTFTYTIKDTKGATDTATVTVVVNSPLEKPEEPAIPDEPIEEPEKPEVVLSETKTNQGELPKTGGNYYFIMALGVALLAIGISLKFASRKA